MTEPTYTIKEILDIQFANLTMKLDAIDKSLEKQRLVSDEQFRRLDAELDGLRKELALLKEEHARYKVIWGIGATLSATMAAFLLNRFF